MGISVFSNYIIECCVLCQMASQRKARDEIETPTLSEAMDFYIKKFNYEPHLLLSLHPENEIVDNEISYKCATKPELHTLIHWTSKNILLCVRKDWKIQTRSVKLRIMTGMLNNLAKCGCISKEESIYIHDNVVKNMQSLSNDLMFSDLPF